MLVGLRIVSRTDGWKDLVERLLVEIDLRPSVAGRLDLQRRSHCVVVLGAGRNLVAVEDNLVPGGCSRRSSLRGLVGWRRCTVRKPGLVDRVGSRLFVVDRKSLVAG